MVSKHCAAKLSAKFAQFFDTTSERKLTMVGGGENPDSQNVFGDISGRGVAQNLKIAAQFNAE